MKLKGIFKRRKPKSSGSKNQVGSSRVAAPPPSVGHTGPVAGNNTWTNLATLSRLLNQTSLFAPVAEVIDYLNWFISAHEDTIIARKDYEVLKIQLEELFEDISGQFARGIPPTITTGMLNLCRAIQTELKQLHGTQDRTIILRRIQADQDLERLMGCYRRIQGHLERVMLNLSLNIFRMMDKQTTEARLCKLNPSMSARHDSAEAHLVQRRECTANTREQVLLDLEAWKNNCNGENICWMNGMAGTGKTTIAMTMCSLLCKSYELGASFFCSRSLPACRDVKLILPTIAYQLARFSSPFRGALLQTMDYDPDLHTRVLRAQFKHMILEPLQVIEKTLPANIVVVIDALDECEDGSGVEQILEILLEYATKLPVKFLISSRPELHIRERMARSSRKSQLILHELDEKIVKQDIEIYLRNELSRMILPDDQLAALIEKAGVLFIYAATAVRYISAGNFTMMQKKRLETVLGVSRQGSLKKDKEIDALYDTVLSSALNNPSLEPSERGEMELVLHTVVCAQEPLTSIAITELLQLDHIDQVHAALQPLWSVLHISESDKETRISALHASFPDYMLDCSRSGQFACGAEAHNRRLAALCLGRIQRNKIQFNVCGLESSYLFDEDVPNIDDEVKKAIPSDLMYACQYWATHLNVGGTYELDTQVKVVEEFLSRRLLLWMEIINLTKRADKGIEQLEKAESWLCGLDCFESIKSLTHDARRFVTMFTTSSLSKSTPHLYVSMLVSWPDHRPISRCYIQRALGIIKIKGIQTAERQLGLLSMIAVKCEVYCVAFSSNGSFFAAGTSDNTILIWDALSCRMTIDPIGGHTASIQTIAISPDGTRICSGSRDRTLCIWDSQSGRQIAGPLVGHTRWVLSVNFSPDGLRLASGSADGTVWIWSAQNGQAKGTPFEGRDGEIKSVVFSPDGSIIAVVSESTIHLWDPENERAICDPLKRHTNPVRASFLPDGRRLVSASEDGTVAIWDISGQTVIGSFQAHPLEITAMAVSPDGTLIASGSADCTVKIWDTQGRKAHSDLWHTDCVESIAFSPDSLRLISGSKDNNIRIWEIQDLNEKVAESPSDGHSDWVRTVAFSPCGAYVVSGSDDTTARLWNVQSGKLSGEPLRGHNGRVLSVAISADGSHIVSISDDRTIRIWSWQTRDLEGIINLTDADDHFPLGYKEQWPAAFVFDGRRVAFGSYAGSVYMWDGRKLPFEPREHSEAVMAISFSPDGRLVVSGSRDKKIIIWDASSGKRLLNPLVGHTGWIFSVEFSPDGSQIASGSEDKTIRLWDSSNGLQRHTTLRGHTGAVHSVTFSPQGTQIVSGSQDRSIRVWDIANGQSIAIFNGHTDKVCSVAFSPNGAQIVSGSADMTIRLWKTPTANHESHPNNSIGPVKPHKRLSDLEWAMDEDGWIRDTQHQRLLWVPPDLRSIVLRPQNTSLISRQGCIELDFSEAQIGSVWANCYHPL